MKPLDYIWQYAEQKTVGDNSILYAMIRCLSAREALTLLRRAYKEAPALRDATLYVLDDLQGEDREQAMAELAYQILDEFESIPANRRSSAFLCLGELLKRLADKDSHEIRVFLLRSKYAAGRRKGLKSLEAAEVLRYGTDVQKCAYEHGEYLALKLIISHFPPEYVFEHRHKLRAMILDAPWAVARLYLRAAEYRASCLNELKEYDGITYSYAKAKRGERITLNEAERLLGEFRLDDRIGLLAWAFGKMGLWEVLVQMAERADDWTKESFDLLRSRYDA